MKLKDGYLIHVGNENLNWVAIFDNGKWWACRKLSIGESPALLASYEVVHEIDQSTDVHLHAHVLSYPIPMLAALLNN